jgi:gliding motility-associated-like protein
MVKTELVIFDRSGVQVYKNENYDNLWDGVDYKGNPLPDDTYFCIIKRGNRKIVTGYIVVRR